MVPETRNAAICDELLNAATFQMTNLLSNYTGVLSMMVTGKAFPDHQPTPKVLATTALELASEVLSNANAHELAAPEHVDFVVTLLRFTLDNAPDDLPAIIAAFEALKKA